MGEAVESWVPKPSSVSTALRVVSNSSLKNNKSGGISYNDLLVKGPNSLQPLLQVQADFRTLPHVVAWDYAKAYNTVLTYPEEMHMRRMVWRESEDKPWKMYGINRMHFGDRPAAAGPEVAKKKVAEYGRPVDSQTADIIMRGYVDDGLGGGDREVVDKLVGEEILGIGTGPLEETGGVTGHSTGNLLSPSMPTYTGTVAKIMGLGGFKVKYMIRNGERRPEILELYGGSVLGLPWDTNNDMLRLSMDVNLTQKKQGVRSSENLKPGDEHQIKDAELTRRKLMSQVHGIYDPLGLLSPITIKFKLVLQKMVEAKLDWDDVLQGDLEKEARAALTEMVASGAIAFPRCVLGESYKKEVWMLMGFWDGGKPASACCLYARTPLREKGPEGETHLVRLLAGKARVTPTSSSQGRPRASTPRTEMRGLLMLARLIDELLPGIQVPPTEIMLMGDSQCTIACVEADNRVLDIWFSNRVAEVQDRMESWKRKSIKVNPLYHWPGESNIADLSTKGRAEARDVIQGTGCGCDSGLPGQ